MTTDRSSTPPDWRAITEAVARQLKGEPNAQLSSRRELRWGQRGSFQLTIDGDAEGRWKDWESGQGGRGAVSLAEYLLGTDRNGALNWLRQGRYLSEPSSPPTHQKSKSVPANHPEPVDRSAPARSIWASGASIPRDETHPVRRWFENRHLWRPELPTPPMLRWRAVDGQHTGASSIIVLLSGPMAWTDHWPSLPEPMAVQMIAIDDDGNAALDRPVEMGGLGKRTIGNAKGAVAVIGNPMLSVCSNPVRVAEGIADALAIASRYDTPVVAVAGTSGMRSPELTGWLAAAYAGTIIHADADSSRRGKAPAGTTAAGFLRLAIADSGGKASAIYPPERYKDAAEAAQATGFPALGDDWIEYAHTLAETTDWPRWEIARIAQIATSGA